MPASPSIICHGALLMLAATVGRAALADDESPPADEAARQQRLAYLQRTFAEFELNSAEDTSRPLGRSDKPLLRYSNPVRNFFSDGATFLWLDGRRPAGAGTISIRGRGDVWWEFTSFSAQPLRCLRQQQLVWTPQSGNLVRAELPDAPRAAASARLRLIQLRRQARRFAIQMQESASQPDQVKMLRLMDKPIHRWSDESAQVVDGALYAFVETTDPEAFLLLELIRPAADADPAWRYTFARMTSRPLELRLDDAPVELFKGYWANPRSQNDPYAAARLGSYEPASTDADDKNSGSTLRAVK